MLLESACIPVPSEVIMLYAGYLVSAGKLGLIGAVAAGGGAEVGAALVEGSTGGAMVVATSVAGTSTAGTSAAGSSGGSATGTPWRAPRSFEPVATSWSSEDRQAAVTPKRKTASPTARTALAR